MKALLAAALLVLVVASPVAARHGSCSVTPNPVKIQHPANGSAFAYFTVEWTTGTGSTVRIHEPAPGPEADFGLPATGSLDWQTPYAGTGSVEIVDIRGHTQAACTFEVLP